MDLNLNEYELRALAALVEKQIATPDYYPLTRNALINACNQKNHRDPVVAYDEPTVERAIESLKEKKLVYFFHGAESRVPKYGHLFPKAFDLTEGEVALMCVLILRGPQTSGELRSRSPHLHNFESLAEVESLLQGLASRETPLVVKLPRQTGERESRYAHLLGGEVIVEAGEADQPSASAAPRARADNEKIAELERAVESLREELGSLKQQFAEFKKQFE